MPLDARILRIEPPIHTPIQVQPLGLPGSGAHGAPGPGDDSAMRTPSQVERRMLFILHRGLVEARLLAQAGKLQQVLDLADALEPLPGWLAAWKDEYVEDVRLSLECYARKYPDAFGYLDFVDRYEPPPF